MTETIVIKVGGHASKLLDDQFYTNLPSGVPRENTS